MAQALQKTENPFSNQAVGVPSNNALAEAESQRAIQEVQAAMVIAKKFPRDPVQAMDRILNACTRPTLAASALYSYPRGGQEITGPSIRLAEAMAQEWGNMQFGIRELSAQNGISTVEAFAWDVETNTRQVKTFKVSHQRYSKAKGLTALTDPRDIYEHIANQGARRLRACILGVIPGDVTEAAVQQCGVTQSANVEVTAETIQKMLDSFKDEFGVTTEMIQQRIQKRPEAINAPQMLSLKKIFQSMRDGMSKPADWFEMGDDQTGGKVNDLNEQLADKPANKKTAKKKPEPKHSAAYTKLSAAVDIADTSEQINSVINQPDWSELQDGEAQQLQTVIAERRKTIDAETQPTADGIFEG